MQASFFRNVPCYLVCTKVHQCVEEFSGQLSNALSTVVLCTHHNVSKDLTNRRGATRLLSETCILGMHPDVNSVASVLRELMKACPESRDIAISNLDVGTSFVGFVCQALLLPPPANESNEKAPEPSWENEVAPIQVKQTITAALESYYKPDASNLYEESMHEPGEAELAIVCFRQTKGTVDNACITKHASARPECERIY